MGVDLDYLQNHGLVPAFTSTMSEYPSPSVSTSRGLVPDSTSSLSVNPSPSVSGLVCVPKMISDQVAHPRLDPMNIAINPAKLRILGSLIDKPVMGSPLQNEQIG